MFSFCVTPKNPWYSKNKRTVLVVHLNVHAKHPLRLRLPNSLRGLNKHPLLTCRSRLRVSHNRLPGCPGQPFHFVGQPKLHSWLPDRATKSVVICLHIFPVGQPKMCCRATSIWYWLPDRATGFHHECETLRLHLYIQFSNRTKLIVIENRKDCVFRESRSRKQYTQQNVSHFACIRPKNCLRYRTSN